MSEEQLKPTNQEDIQALDELRREAVANGTMAEQTEAFSQQAESVGVDVDQRYGGYDPSSGLTYKEYLEQGGSSGAQLRADAAAERAQRESSEIDASDKDLLDQVWKKIGNDLRGRTDELEAGGMTRQEAGAQAIDEFWGPREADTSADSGNESGRNHGLRPSTPEDVARALRENPEAMDPDNDDGVGLAAIASIGQEPWTIDQSNDGEPPKPPEPPTDTPPKPPEPPEELTPIPPIDLPPEDPIIDDGPVDIPPEPPYDAPPEPPRPRGPEDDLLPELAKSPELLEAEAQLEIARDDYAKMKQGREGRTFFSIKFSKKKLKVAKENYEAIKSRAEALAESYLIRKGLSAESLRSAKNFGRFFEETKLIVSQYGYEQARVDGQNPTLKKFYGWWNDQGNKLFSKGTLKKSAVMAAFGLPIGLAVGIVAGPVLSGGVAGAAALGAMRAVSKGILGHRIKRGAGADDLAEAKAMTAIEDLKQTTDTLEASNQEMTEDYINGLNDRMTKEAKAGNDKEALKAILIAGTAGALGSAVMGALLGSGGGVVVKDPIWKCSAPRPEPAYTSEQVAQDLFKGITSHGPEASRNMVALLEQAKALGVPPGPINKGLDQLILNQMHGLQPNQAHRIGEIIGDLSAPQGGGIPHEWFLTGNNAELVTDLVKQGLTNQEITNQILTNFSGTTA